jgi:outer membrane protein assembly factor BamA
MKPTSTFSWARKNSHVLYTSLAILCISGISGCASNSGFNNEAELQQKPILPKPALEFKPVSDDKKVSKDRLELGVGYTAYRGANVYGNYKGFFDSSIVEANTQLALSDKLVNANQLFTMPDSQFSIGYSASFRDFKIVPNNSSTKNRQIALNAIGTMFISDRETLFSTLGAEKIDSNTGMAGATGSQLMFPATVTYRNDERVHPQIPTEGFGYFLKTNLELSAIGEQYIKGSARGQLDIPLNKITAELDKFALSFKFFAGTETSLNNSPVPIVKRFYLENGSPVRGYAANAFGYNANNAPIGGDLMATGSVELWIPLFHEDLRAYTFFDAGIMRGNGINTNRSNLKTSTGIGIAWDSPVGVISAYYGQALEKNAVHIQNIGIGLGINY